ncbi:MAG: glycerophosphodiester phosphodiesterase family protein [Thermaurantimonas sp.]
MSPYQIGIALLVQVLIITGSCTKPTVEIHGHRGCRGYWPENSVHGMIEAVKMGVDVLEMDVVISKDLQVVLSHEPFFHYEICLDPNGNRIYESTQEAYNIYEFTYAQIQNTRCGTFPHPRFPLQRQMEYYKPTLSQVIDTVEKLVKKLHKSIQYNIEIKARDEWEGIFHPDHKAFSDLVAGVIYRHGIVERSVIQSFHLPTLQYLHLAHPHLRLALLVDEDENMTEKYSQLGLTPYILSPHYSLVTVSSIKFFKSRGVKIVPWTVNDIETAAQLIKSGVHGIITDYPDSILRIAGR